MGQRRIFGGEVGPGDDNYWRLMVLFVAFLGEFWESVWSNGGLASRSFLL